MTRLPLAALITAAVLLSACGDDTIEPIDTVSVSDIPVTEPSTTTSPTTADVDAAQFEHPTGPDDVVLSSGETGGFTTREFSFQRPPSVLVTGDGRVITAGATIAIFPGPLLPALQEQPITEEGIQELLGAADEAGLLRDVDYADDADQFIADATTAVVEIAAEGESWVHSAYALGISTPPGGTMELSPDREALLDFVESLSDLATVVGAQNLGEPEPFVPETYEIVAVPIDDPSVPAQDGIDPTIVDWPAEVDVRLADAMDCTVVAADQVDELFESADQLTLFVDAELTYQLLVRQVIPGRSCADG
jgi:hypothetical protein